jgi:capsid protein
MASFVSQEIVGISTGSPAPAAASAPAQAAIRYVSQPSWNARRWEAAETTRLNEAHWLYAQDESINAWLSEQLSTLRARSTYEAKQNGILLGMLNTYADYLIGSDGPTLQVISDDESYNTALERTWQDWFYCPTPRRNVSGAALLKLWSRGLWKGGEFLAQFVTDDTAEGPVQMRVKPIHPRRLATPPELSGNPNCFMGVEYDRLGRPIRYHIQDQQGIGTGWGLTSYSRIPADMIIHEYLFEEEDQGRGVPWLTTSLTPAGDLRDYDDQVQDAARQMADQSMMLYADRQDVEPSMVPETAVVERRTIKMAPPGWKPFVYNAAQPPVQYPDYRAERQRELGRPMGMPLLLIRLDASKHSWSSARVDLQPFSLALRGIQTWLSGSERSCGVLSRLVDEVAREARFSDSALRRKPPRVSYKWTWPQIPYVDPQKEKGAQETGLRNMTTTMTEALASEGKTLETHVATLRRERQVLTEAELPLPAWMTNPGTPNPTAAAQAAAGEKEDDTKPEEATK